MSARAREDRIREIFVGRAAANCAFTHLDDLVTEVRAAGHYAFRDEPANAKRFTNPLPAPPAPRLQSEAPVVEVVVEEVVGEMVAEV